MFNPWNQFPDKIYLRPVFFPLCFWGNLNQRSGSNNVGKPCILLSDIPPNPPQHLLRFCGVSGSWNRLWEMLASTGSRVLSLIFFPCQVMVDLSSLSCYSLANNQHPRRTLWREMLVSARKTEASDKAPPRALFSENLSLLPQKQDGWTAGGARNVWLAGLGTQLWAP